MLQIRYPTAAHGLRAAAAAPVASSLASSPQGRTLQTMLAAAEIRPIDSPSTSSARACLFFAFLTNFREPPWGLFKNFTLPLSTARGYAAVCRASSRVERYFVGKFTGVARTHTPRGSHCAVAHTHTTAYLLYCNNGSGYTSVANYVNILSSVANLLLEITFT